MELTPQVINEVEFSMARRGYDPDQVDEFLEKVAVAVGALNDRVAQLQDRLTLAERRVAEAEQRGGRAERVVAAPAAANGGVSAAAEAELETLKRTLLLAQRTADAAVREAEEEARRLLAEAESDARSAHEATRRAVLEEIATLEESRAALHADVEALDGHLDGQRMRLQATIADLQRILDEPDLLRPATLPEQNMLAMNGDASPEAVVEEESAFVLAEELGDDEAWAQFGAAEEVLDAGPPTQPVLRLDQLERETGDDDAYLSELRKAMLDDTGAPDVADLDMFDDADVGRAARTGRFGRRR